MPQDAFGSPSPVLGAGAGGRGRARKHNAAASPAGGLKSPALGDEACLRRLIQAAQAAFVHVARGFSHRAGAKQLV